MRLRKVIKKMVIGIIAASMAVTAFPYAGRISEVYADENTEFNGFSYEINDEGTITITGYSGSEKNIVIPNEIDEKTVTDIGEYAFEGCRGMTSLSIPDSIANIRKFAFAGCDGLTTVTIPATVTNIGEGAFTNSIRLTTIKVSESNRIYDSRKGCNAIIETKSNKLLIGCKNTVIPEGVTRIASYAFVCCMGMTKINIPKSVTKIESSAFYDCINLKDVYYSGSRERWLQTDIDLGNECLVNKKFHFAETKTVSITKAIVSGIVNKTYSGRSHSQSKLLVKCGGRTLKKGTDYTVTYKNNKSVGKATVIIKGKNTYTGTITRTFIIKPKATSISKITTKKKTFSVTIKKLTTGTSGYQIQYGTKSSFKGAKVKSVSNKTTKVTISKLASKKKYYVRLRTYKNVKINGKNVKIFSKWSKVKSC